jgi:hypothetical protein
MPVTKVKSRWSSGNLIFSTGGTDILKLDADNTVVDFPNGLSIDGSPIVSEAELEVLDGVTAGTVTASKAVVVDTNKDIATFRNLTLSGNLVSGSATISETDITKIDAITNGTLAGSKAVVVNASKEINEWFVTATSASTDGGTSVEPMVFSSTMTGAGGVGGRARFQLDTNVALGGWANALKGQTVFGASGAVTGLGSAVVSELTLSAGTSSGTYAPSEIELNLGSGASTGTQTSLIYASVNGDGAGAFDDAGGIISINGVTIDSGHVIQASAVSDIDSTHAMKIFINGTAYYIPLNTSAAFGG